MEKNNFFIALLLLTVTFNTYSMKRQEGSKEPYVQLTGAVLLGQAEIQPLLEPNSSVFSTLSPEIFEKIILLLSLHNNAESLEESAKAISSLAQVNKELNELINDSDFCLRLIKILAKKFNLTNQEVAQKLQTQETQRRCEIQNKLYNAIIKDKTNNIINLYTPDIDLEFTYNDTNQYLTKIVTPLMLAAIYSADTIPFLLEVGADINAANVHKYTALMIAAMQGQENAVQYLLNNANLAINQKDLNGWTALSYAISNNDITIVKKLLNANADPNVPFKEPQFDDEDDEEIYKNIIDLINNAKAKQHEKK